LIAHGHVPLSMVLSELHAMETRLCGVGLLGVPSMVAAQAPPVLTAAPRLSHSSAPPLLATPSDSMGCLPFRGGGRSSHGGSRSHPPRI
jgi:hypothetical protein